MVGKIISGGQTGCDRAALDVALELRIPVGGYAPKGRRADDGVVPARYPLVELDSVNYAVRTVRNVEMADGVLILNTDWPMSGGTKLTYDVARGKKKPHWLVDLATEPWALRRVVEEHRRIVADRLNGEPSWTLMVGGPRESKAPGVYAAARAFLLAVLSPG